MFNIYFNLISAVSSKSQFYVVWTEYDHVMMSFECYNITGSFCANPSAAIWSRDRRSMKTEHKVEPIYTYLPQLCVQLRRRAEVTHLGIITCDVTCQS